MMVLLISLNDGYREHTQAMPFIGLDPHEAINVVASMPAWACTFHSRARQISKKIGNITQGPFLGSNTF
jgi:hypothetical protein